MGPINVRSYNETKKVWIALFTCFTIHIELVEELSAEAFLNTFRKLIARRGVPESILSDNAKQFTVISKLFSKLINDSVNSQEFQSYFSSKQIKWRFITEYAPWMGDVYERLNGLVKNCLKKAIGNKFIDKEQLNILTCETEAILNSRPIT